MATHTVKLRFYEPSDATALFEAARESVREVHPWLAWCHPDYAVDEARTWIASQVEARDKCEAYAFTIVGDSDRMLGGCGLNEIRRPHRCANLGYWVRSSETGRGVAWRAVRLLATWAFRDTDLERLEILAATGNVRSQRVAEKAGAQREGTLRSRLLVHGEFQDAVVYSIVRSTWPVSR